jgi:hypothetical protein
VQQATLQEKALRGREPVGDRAQPAPEVAGRLAIVDDRERRMPVQHLDSPAAKDRRTAASARGGAGRTFARNA